MSRNFRIYQKKRGNRRTGSSTMARLSETIFFGLFFLGGCAGLIVILVTQIIPQWRVNHEFVKTTCTVRAKELVEEDGPQNPGFRPEITIDYQVNGTSYQSKAFDISRLCSQDRESQQTALDAFEIGKEYYCWYDPIDPDVVVLVRGNRWLAWLLLVIPLSFILIGGGGFLYRALHWGKSAEHRAATGTVPIRLRPANANENDRSKFPTVPTSVDMANSPGTTLQFRLPISSTATVGLMVLALVCLFWNVVSVFLVLDVVSRFLAKDPNWVETGVVAPLALVGLLLIYFFFRRLLIVTGVGPTLLEISDHPLHPGKKYELFLSQAGRLRMHSIELSLVGTEEARYRQGTDTRTEIQRVYRQSLVRKENFKILGGSPLEIHCELELPDGIMHSFKSENNALGWSLVVEGKVAGWPDYRRSFPVVIYPSESEETD